MKKYFMIFIFFCSLIPSAWALKADFSLGVGVSIALNTPEYLTNTISNIGDHNSNINKKMITEDVASYIANLRWPIIAQLGLNFGFWSVGLESGIHFGGAQLGNKGVFVYSVPIYAYVDLIHIFQFYTGGNWTGSSGSLNLNKTALGWDYDLGIRARGANIFPVFLGFEVCLNLHNIHDTSYRINTGVLYDVF